MYVLNSQKLVFECGKADGWSWKSHDHVESVSSDLNIRATFVSYSVRSARLESSVLESCSEIIKKTEEVELMKVDTPDEIRIWTMCSSWT